MTADTLIHDRALPTAELLAQLLRVLQSTPRRAPDEVVELVQRELERQAGPFEGDASDTVCNADKEEE